MSFFFAAVASQIYYQWTSNNVALGIVMVGAAWLATKIVSVLLTLWRIFLGMLARVFGQKRVHGPRAGAGRFNESTGFLLSHLGPNFGPKLRNTGRYATIRDAFSVLRSA